MGKINGKEKVKGFGNIEYELDELKNLSPKCHTREEIAKNDDLKTELERRKSYHEKIYNSAIDILPHEKWVSLKDFKDLTKYQVSNYGRIKWDNKIIKQDDTEDTRGYLRLDFERNFKISHDVFVYTLVACAFLNKKPGDKKHVHHINNNGYDNRPENLILLEAEQHSYVHGFSCGNYKD